MKSTAEKDLVRSLNPRLFDDLTRLAPLVSSELLASSIVSYELRDRPNDEVIYYVARKEWERRIGLLHRPTETTC